MLVFLYKLIISVCICAIATTNISFYYHQCDYVDIEKNIITHIITHTNKQSWIKENAPKNFVRKNNPSLIPKNPVLIEII